MSDIAWVIQFERLRNQVFIYNHEERSAERASHLDTHTLFVLDASRKESLLLRTSMSGSIASYGVGFIGAVKMNQSHI